MDFQQDINKTEVEAPSYSTIRKNSFSISARVAQFYNLVEYLSQVACAMSMLEVPQSCLAQQKNLLLALGAIDPKNYTMITFNVENYKLRLSHQIAFQIATRVVGRKVHRTVLDEGASTSVLSMSCWRSLGSLELNKSPTTLKYFDGQGFQPHGLLLVLSIESWGKNVSIQVEVVDAPLD